MTIALDGTRRTVEGAAFVAAIVLPVTYLPLLATGVTTVDESALVLALLLGHAASIVAGRGYGQR